MQNKNVFLSIFCGIFFIGFIVIIFSVFKQQNIPGFEKIIKPFITEKKINTQTLSQLNKFKNEQEFKDYFQTSQNNNKIYSESYSTSDVKDMRSSVSSVLPQTGGALSLDRTSQTNVQVFGIDEPDIVKTKENNIFYSSPYRRIFSDRIPAESMKLEQTTFSQQKISAINPFESGGIVNIKAFPPETLQKLNDLNIAGEMLVSHNILIVFNEQNYQSRYIVGYNIKDPSNIQEVWKIKLNDNSTRVAARLYKDKLYVITSTTPHFDKPCLMHPLDFQSATGNTIKCTDIYHPNITIDSDTIYSAYTINPENGTKDSTVSFVGSSGNATIYMSRNAIYIAYSYQTDTFTVMSQFVFENPGLFPQSIEEHIKKLQGYDISNSARMVEIERLIGNFINSMESEKRIVFENNLQNKAKLFMQKHKREIASTGIVKIGINSFNVQSIGNIPGRLLNQFSMDEYEKNLRVATTIGDNIYIGPYIGSSRSNESESAVYILNDDLKVTGQVEGLGKTERIYSTRFIADKGYVVTYRQTDPFYVLDLSNPYNPTLSGELKIPGYSSYLHALRENIILGVGEDAGQVKLTLFDVTDASNPKELDTYMMKEYWTEANTNHHAFLEDSKHEIFFIPGGQGGYVFSYKNNKLEMVKAVADYQVKRAVYINDYLYILGDNKIVAVDENTRETVGELDLMFNNQ